MLKGNFLTGKYSSLNNIFLLNGINKSLNLGLSMLIKTTSPRLYFFNSSLVMNLLLLNLISSLLRLKLSVDKKYFIINIGLDSFPNEALLSPQNLDLLFHDV